MGATNTVLLIGGIALLVIIVLILRSYWARQKALLPQYRELGGARVISAVYPPISPAAPSPTGHTALLTSPGLYPPLNDQTISAWPAPKLAQAKLRVAERATAAAEAQRIQEVRQAEAQRAAEAQQRVSQHQERVKEELAIARRREAEEQERAEQLLAWKVVQAERDAEVVRVAKEETRKRKETMARDEERKAGEARIKKALLDAARKRGERDAAEACAAAVGEPKELPTSPKRRTRRNRAARGGKSAPLGVSASKRPPLYRQTANYHDDPYYTDLRLRANAAGDAMALSFEVAGTARQQGKGGLAKNHVAAGVHRRDEMEELHAQASAWIFARNNENLPIDTVDLHGLYVDEACYYATLALQSAPGRSISSLKFIVGRGKHSVNGIAKIKPAIEDLLRSRNLAVDLLPRNPGVLIVRLPNNVQP